MEDQRAQSPERPRTMTLVARLSGLWILSSFPDFGTTGKAMADK